LKDWIGSVWQDQKWACLLTA